VDGLSKTLDAFSRKQELRESWQGRLLRTAQGKTGAVLLSVLADSYDAIMLPLLKAVFPGFIEPALPCLCSSAKIGYTGAIFAEVMLEDGRKEKRLIYFSSQELQDDMRRLADRAKLTDVERLELFVAVKKWVVADFRLDPTFDPRDPDARRLVH